MKDPITAWLDNETGYQSPDLVPVETEDQRNARLIREANTHPLSPAELFDHLIGVEKP